jgi:hypothetical protein
MVHWHWCLYVWDFHKKTILVLDPRWMHVQLVNMDSKHKKTVTVMHCLMKECNEVFLCENNCNMEDWKTEYVAINSAQVDRYCIHGTNFTFSMC